ncbi:MAG: D-alanine--D-alanine ligase [Verrucomicrobia bacterium]|nr:D-alanine--D-alanine ligase [Verrucomicrobiota bacterium]
MKPLSEMKVVVLAGGPGSERLVSLASGKAVSEALRSVCPSVALLELEGREFALPPGTDLVFNVIHGTFGEDGDLQMELERRGVPYTGAGVASSRLAFDKIASKERFLEHGVLVARHEVIPADPDLAPPIGFPCVVKPPCEGSSVGVHIVPDASGWRAAVLDAGRYGATLMVEEYVKGKELTVGILGDQALPVIHIQPEQGFYDINNKYPWLNQKGATQYFCPADLPPEVGEAVRREALKAHQALGVEIYSRVDLLLEEATGRIVVLEVNTIPGMTSSSLLPKAARAQGIEFEQLCSRIALESLALRTA